MALNSGKTYIVREKMLNEDGEYDIIYKVTSSDAVYRKDSVVTVENDLSFWQTYGIYDGRTTESQVASNGRGIPLYTALKDMDSAEFQTIFVDTLIADETYTNYLSSAVAQIANASLDYVQITNEIAKSITVADLKAGDLIVSDDVKIKSENGNLLINGNTMQFLDKDGNVGIQIGYGEVTDSEGTVIQEYSNPSITISDANGNTILNSTGITSYAISDGLIVNQMIQDGSVSEDKLSFDIVTDDNGKILIESIYDRDGKKFGDTFKEFSTTTNESLVQLSNRIDENETYVLYIDMPRGSNITPNGVQMTAVLYRNSVDVTDEFPNSCFRWIRHSNDEEGDAAWNDKDVFGKTITVYDADIIRNARFECYVDDSQTDLDEQSVAKLDESRLNYSILG